MLTKRAYLAYRGWHVARLAAEAGRYDKALHFYSIALVSGALPPRLAAKALAQILIPRSVYCRLGAECARAIQRELGFERRDHAVIAPYGINVPRDNYCEPGQEIRRMQPPTLRDGVPAIRRTR